MKSPATPLLLGLFVSDSALLSSWFRLVGGIFLSRLESGPRELRGFQLDGGYGRGREGTYATRLQTRSTNGPRGDSWRREPKP